MPDDESDVMSNDAFDQHAELAAMHAPGAVESLAEKEKAIAARLTPDREKSPSDVPYVTWIPSEDRAGLGMRMGVRMVEYRALVAGLPTRYMRVQYDPTLRDRAVVAYQATNDAALLAYQTVAWTIPRTPPSPWWMLWRSSAPGPTPLQHSEVMRAYTILKQARKEAGVAWEKALTDAKTGETNAGEPDIESLDPQTYFYKLMSSHKGKRAEQLVELGKMGRTEKKPQRRGFFGLGRPQ